MLFMTALTTFTSCSKEENESYEPIYSPIGNTYETGSLSLYFGSADTVSFQCLDPWLENIKGKYVINFFSVIDTLYSADFLVYILP